MTMGTHNESLPLPDDLRRLQLEADQLKNELAAAVQQNHALRGQLDVFERKDQIRNDANPSNAEVLQLAELIIENSPAILFRRLAASDPKDRKMVYVSPNIARFGYRAEDFLSGRVMFRDILYSEDFDRTLQEIQSYVSRNIETYTQVYRIVTRESKVR